MKFSKLLFFILSICFGTFLQAQNKLSNDFTLQQASQKDTIKVLNLAYGALTILPNWVYECKNLEELNISGNLFTKLPQELVKLEKLKKIRWADNLKPLEKHADLTLLQQNKGTREGFLYLMKLKIELARTKISLQELILELPNLPQVKYLDISGNELRKLPKSLKKLKNLETLLIKRNKLTELPKLKGCKELDSIYFDENEIVFTEKTKFRTYKRIKVLSLVLNKIDRIPAKIRNLKVVRNLSFSNNQIITENVSSELATLQNLQQLSFYRNKLSTIPTSVFALSQLQELDVYHNTIDSISSDIANLKQLKVLALSYNHIKYLPKEIEKLTNLEHIYLNYNQLSEFTQDFSQCEKLQSFHAHHNQIRKFPNSLIALKNLQQIELYNNSLTNLPTTLWQMPNLKELYIYDNPITTNEKVKEEVEKQLNKLREKGVLVK